MLGAVLLFLLIGMCIGSYGGSPSGTIKYMCKWLVAKYAYDFAVLIISRITERYVNYGKSFFG